jgi:RNA polymerase sigma factor (sigma-70 family)
MRAAHRAARCPSSKDGIMSDNDDAELRRKYQEAFAAMPRKQREIFLAHRLDDLSYAEIAERTGLTLRQVERQIAKALYKLCKQMDGQPLSWWERWF